MDAATAHRRRWATLGVLCICLLVIGLDNTVLNVALPTLATSLHAGQSQLQWIVDAYTLVFAGLLLTTGSLGDRFGRRKALFAGLAWFGGASLWAAWAGSAGELIAARGAMAVGAAFIMPATLSVLTNSFTDPKERARAIGVWAGVSGLGIVFGPTLGGWLLQHFWWGSVFLINVPVVVAGLIAGFWLVPESRDPSAPRIDVGGALLSIAGLSTLIWAIIEAPERGWESPSILTGFVVAAVLIGLFALWESRVREPMLDLGYFRNRRFASGCLSVTLLFFGLFGTVFFLTQYLQFVLGYTALEAGQRVLPVATLVLGAPLGVRLAERIGEKFTVGLGMGVVATGMGLLATTSVDSGYGHVAAVLAIMGLGMGTAMAPATEAVMGALPKDKAGVGSAVNDATRHVGGAFGVAVLGSILSSAYGDRLRDELPGQAVPEVATDGLAGALAIAERLPADVGRAFAAAAREAFVHGMDVTVAVGAGVAALGALLALAWMPSRAPAAPPEATPVAASDVEERELEPSA
ncbi:MAG TPA: MFS transporter [Kineosporiaceae bacterium]|nr:MFS transporter [Kineosporiaceae bacterium]